MEVQVQLLAPTAILPTRASEDAVGYDLYASEPIAIPASQVTMDGCVNIGRALVSTGITLAVPPGHYGRIAPRSGLALHHGIDIGAGVIDPDYRDEVKVLLLNFSAQEFSVRPGDRIAQLIFERISIVTLVAATSLRPTGRKGGFGSTGLT
jgi:dUTP pyrophosphatase